MSFLLDETSYHKGVSPFLICETLLYCLPEMTVYQQRSNFKLIIRQGREVQLRSFFSEIGYLEGTGFKTTTPLTEAIRQT